MNDLLEGNFNNNRKQITGTDLLFNKNKISNEVASLSSSLSSLSSQSSNHSLSRKIKKPIYNNEDYEDEVVRPKIKIHKPVIQNDVDVDEE